MARDAGLEELMRERLSDVPDLKEKPCSAVWPGCLTATCSALRATKAHWCGWGKATIMPCSTRRVLSPWCRVAASWRDGSGLSPPSSQTRHLRPSSSKRPSVSCSRCRQNAESACQITSVQDDQDSNDTNIVPASSVRSALFDPMFRAESWRLETVRTRAFGSPHAAGTRRFCRRIAQATAPREGYGTLRLNGCPLACLW